MLKMQYGPGIELFEMHGPEQREPQRANDFGLQRFAKAAGEALTPPQPLGFSMEKGEGNCFCYGCTPWGSIVEFISHPSPMPYEHETPQQLEAVKSAQHILHAGFKHFHAER